MTNEQSLRMYNHYIRNKDEYFVKVYKMNSEEKRAFRSMLLKEMNEMHANAVWEWLNDID